jgi:hypothetical protein
MIPENMKPQKGAKGTRNIFAEYHTSKFFFCAILRFFAAIKQLDLR